MEFRDAYDFAKKLRGIARRADTFGHDRQRVLEELIFAAENYETVAEKQEMCMIVQMQRDGVEAN